MEQGRADEREHPDVRPDVIDGIAAPRLAFQPRNSPRLPTAQTGAPAPLVLRLGTDPQSVAAVVDRNDLGRVLDTRLVVPVCRR